MIEAYLARAVPRDAQDCLEQVQAHDWQRAGEEWLHRRWSKK
jgi:hypothetical protein